MTIDDKRGKMIDIARSYLSGENFVICREDIPELIDSLISEVKTLHKHVVSESDTANDYPCSKCILPECYQDCEHL